MTSDL